MIDAQLPQHRSIGFGSNLDELNPDSKFPITVPVASGSDATLTYQVVVHDDEGFAVCTCKGFQYRQNCKHCAEARKRVKEDRV